jgi:hypothetical protein
MTIKMSEVRRIFLISLICILIGTSLSCSSRKKRINNHNNLIGTWTIGSLQNNNEELVSWIWVNTISFKDGDSVWTPSYPGSTFSNYGRYEVLYADNEIAKVKIITADTVFRGIYKVEQAQYFHHPQLKDSLLFQLFLRGGETNIWLNSRVTGWR